MSEKRRISRSVVIALGIICIVLSVGLVGTMTYYSMAINEKNGAYDTYASTHQDYVDVLALNVFDASRMANGTQEGAPTVSIELNFAFSPKQEFLNVTKFLFDFVAYQEAPGWHNVNYDMQLNGRTAVTDHFEALDYYPSYRAGVTSDQEILASMHPGLNSMHLNFAGTVFLMKVDIIVEYTYEA